MSAHARIHVVVTGLVQGVGYRYFARREARERGLSGWVKNRPDGSVEVVAEGPEGLLRDFAGALRRGPSSARVTGVDVTPGPYRGEFDDFEVRF